MFVDYGNTENVLFSDIRRLDSRYISTVFRYFLPGKVENRKLCYPSVGIEID
jgi:hypothetical protein